MLEKAFTSTLTASLDWGSTANLEAGNVPKGEAMPYATPQSEAKLVHDLSFGGVQC